MKMSKLLLLVAITIAAVVFCGAHASLSKFEDRVVRCKVCDRAIAHIWHQGVELRKHCKIHGTDPRCYITNLRKDGIEEMVRDVCDDLPKTHQALLHSEFDLVASDQPDHDAAVIEGIRAACVEWVHDRHSVEGVTRLMYANLDAGKSTQVILHRLQERFCDDACKPQPGDREAGAESGDL